MADGVFFELALLALGLAIGFVAPIAGVGGGVIFTPLMLAFTNMDATIVRATGLALAMTDSALGGRRYLAAGATRLDFVMFTAVFMSLGVITGAVFGIRIVRLLGNIGEATIRLALGALLLFAIYMMFTVKLHEVKSEDCRWGRALGLAGEFYDPASGSSVVFIARRIGLSALAFYAVGVISGAFGLGAGWALVPVLNLVMSLPLKVAVATSTSTFIVADAAGLWTYVHEGAAVSHLMAPVTLGAALGANYGAKLALRARVEVIKKVVVVVIGLAGLQLIFRGLAELGVYD